MSGRSRYYAKKAQQMKKRRGALKGIALAVLVCFIIFFAVANIISPTRTFSDGENRNLKTMPGISSKTFADGSFFDEALEAYSDQFVFRDALIGMKAQAEILSGEHEENDVIIGRDGYLFAKPEAPKLKDTEDIAAALNTFADENNKVNVLFILAPCASSVLKDKVPASVSLRDQMSDVNSFGAALSDRVSFINAGDILSEHSDEYIYYRTDHHWTGRGARYVFEAAAQTLGITGELHAPTEHKVSDTFQGTMASKSGVNTHSDSVSIYDYPEVDTDYYVNYNSGERLTASMFESDKLGEKDKYQVFFGGNHSLVEITTDAGTGRNLLIFKDSYANSFVQFLYPYFDKIIMIDPRYYYDDAAQVMKMSGVTDVLFLYSANTLFTDNTLVECIGVRESEE